jgi:hypothetical protein
MVERVARALYAAEAKKRNYARPWYGLPSEVSDEWLLTARSAIEAMREPTDTMVHAGDDMRDMLDNKPHPHVINDVAAIWKAMIGVTLEKSESVHSSSELERG